MNVNAAQSAQLAAQKASGQHGQFGELAQASNAGVELTGRPECPQCSQPMNVPPNSGCPRCGGGTADCAACGSAGDATLRETGDVLCDDCFSDTCRECHAPLDDGEGTDGYCGSCADARSCSECGELVCENPDEMPEDHRCDGCREADDDGFECGHCGAWCDEMGREPRTGSRRCDDLDPNHKYHAPAG